MLNKESLKYLLRSKTNKEKSQLFSTTAKSLYRKLNIDTIKLIVNDNIINEKQITFDDINLLSNLLLKLLNWIIDLFKEIEKTIEIKEIIKNHTFNYKDEDNKEIYLQFNNINLKELSKYLILILNKYYNNNLFKIKGIGKNNLYFIIEYNKIYYISIIINTKFFKNAFLLKTHFYNDLNIIKNFIKTYYKKDLSLSISSSHKSI